jgi:putative copper export protein
MLKLSLFLHIISAIFWIGGMLFLSLVIVPFLLALKDPKDRSAVYRQIGPKYRTLAWIAIIILLITGPLNLYLLGINPAIIFTPDFLATSYGKMLLIKLILVFIIVVSSLLHDFWVGPKARESKKFSTYARIFGRTNLIIAILIVLFAVFVRTAG